MWAQAIAAGLPAVSAIIAELVAAGDDAQAEALRKQAMEEYGFELPPVREVAAQAVQSQAAGAQGSQEAKAARLAALRRLQQVSQEGYTAEDRAAVNDMMGEVNARERGQREAIMSRMDPNSGAAIAAQLSNQQAAAQRAHSGGLNMAADSRRRALQALAQGSNLAGDIDEGEFGQAYRRGQASDAISQFNERNRMDAQQFNIQQGNTRFGQQMQLANARAGAKQEMAGDYERRGQRKRRMIAGTGEGLARGFDAYGGKK